MMKTEINLPDSTNLACVPRPGEETCSILAVIFCHPQPVHPLHMETYFVLRVKLPAGLAQFALENTLVCPER